METNDVVENLRSLSSECNGKSIYLPKEIADVINGKQETSWEPVDVEKLLHYIADMLEE